MANILLAVDGHPHGEKVADYAIQLAKAMSATITLVHVITDKTIPENYADMHGDTIPEHYYEDVFERTVAGVKERIEKAGLKYEGVCGVGNPKQFIIDVANSKQSSFIVVGVHGLHSVKKIGALGEVARNVIENASVPVLAVP